MTGVFDGLLAEIAQAAPVTRVGRVSETRRGLAEVTGLDIHTEGSVGEFMLSAR